MIAQAIAACVAKIEQMNVDIPANLQIVQRVRSAVHSFQTEKVTDLSAVTKAVDSEVDTKWIHRVLLYLAEKVLIHPSNLLTM